MKPIHIVVAAAVIAVGAVLYLMMSGDGDRTGHRTDQTRSSTDGKDTPADGNADPSDGSDSKKAPRTGIASSATRTSTGDRIWADSRSTCDTSDSR